MPPVRRTNQNVELASAREELRDLTRAWRETTRGRSAAARAARAAGSAGDVSAAAQHRTTATALDATAHELASRRADLQQHLGAIAAAGTADPCDADAATPLLLLPVRLETRFVLDSAGRPTRLRIRVYPDTIHLDTLVRRLKDSEVVAGQSWWSGAQTDTDWDRLASTVGPRRAAWVAERTRPGSPAPTPDDDDGRVARLLPDRFVIQVAQGSSSVRAVAAPIPDSVPLDLFADAQDAHDVADVADVADPDAGHVDYLHDVPIPTRGAAGALDNDAAWIADFDRAVALGLALEVPWPSGWKESRVDRLVVVGVRTDTPADTADQLDRLLQSHRFDAGLGFVAPGTPTNNTGTTRSGWQPHPPPKPAAEPSEPGQNRARLAAALGIDGHAFDGLDGADDQPDLDAHAANATLWWATWGPLLQMIDVDVPLRTPEPGGPTRAQFRLTDQQLEDIRRLHRDAVRGRGPLPTLRVGAQPYGILPVGQTTHDDWTTTGTDGLVATGLRRARKAWLQAAQPLRTIGATTTDSQLVEAFGTAPVSRAVRARQAGAVSVVDGVESGAGLTTDDALEAFLDTLMLEDFFDEATVEGRSLTFEDPSHHTHTKTTWDNLRLSGTSRPVPLPYSHDTDPERLAQIAAGQTSAAADSLLQALAMTAMQRARRNRDADPPTALGQLAAIPGVSVPPVSRNGRGPAVRDTATLFDRADQARTSTVDAATYRNYDPHANGARSYTDLAMTAGNAAAKAELGQLAAHAVLSGDAVLAELKESILRLAGAHLTTADRHLLVAEALDVASHRYDAWATALASRRLDTLRAHVVTGLHVGAFGWLEDIRPSGTGSYGFLVAPSQAQAVTAGILRSSHLAHQKEGSRDAFAIDLTSARVRAALELVEARRAGQPLGDALGYRIERGLHERQLERFVRNLRRFTSRLTKSPTQTTIGFLTESIAAGRVLDGVRLITLYRQGQQGIDEITHAASLAPQDNPYLETGWLGLQSAETVALVDVIKQASDAMDAVADVLMAESVHQLAQGNIARAAAVCDAASSGASPVPDPSFVVTPTQGDTLDHMIMLLAGSGPGWPAAGSLRAQAAPELEAWAAARLGSPDRVRLATSSDGAPVLLAGTALSALDVVYSSAAPDQLEILIRRLAGLPSRAVLPFTFDRPATGWPADQITFGELVSAADLLRAVLEGAQAAQPADFSPPHGATDRGFDVAAGTARLDAAVAAVQQRRSQLGAGTAMAELDLWQLGIVAGDVGQATRQLDARLDLAAAARGQDPDAADVAAAGQALFGRGFWVLCPSLPGPANDPWTGPSAASSARLRRWLADLAAVRAPLARFSDGVLVCEALGAVVSLSAVQLELDGSPAAQDFAGDTTPDRVALLGLTERSGAVDAPFVALVVERFAEPLPHHGPRTAAVAFNAPAPSACPPQACLLAVPADDSRWTTDRLLDLAQETLTLAKLRGVTYETLSKSTLLPRLLPAIYTQSWSIRADDPVIDWSTTLGLPGLLPYVKES